MRVYAGRGPDGAKRYRSKTFKATGIRDAENQANEAVHQLRREINEATAAKGTMAELIDEWSRHRSAFDSPASIEKRQARVSRIRKQLGRIELAELSARHLDTFYAQLIAEGKSARTVHHHHSLIRAMLRQGERWGMCTGTAYRMATPPKTTRHRPTAPPSDIVNAVLAGATGDMAVAVRLAVATGVRAGELVGLRWSDLAGKQLTVRRSVSELRGGSDGTRGKRRLLVKSTKTDQERTMTLDPATLRALKAHRRTQEATAARHQDQLADDAYILADLAADTSGCTPRRPSWVTARWIEMRGKYGAAGVRWHALRHWHATELLDRGVPITTVSRRLGHAQVSTTLDVYADVVAGSDASAANAVAGALRKPRKRSA